MTKTTNKRVRAWAILDGYRFLGAYTTKNEALAVATPEYYGDHKAGWGIVRCEITLKKK